MPSKSNPDTRAKALRPVLDHHGHYPSECAVIKAVSSRFRDEAETLRNWIPQQQVDDGVSRPGVLETPGRLTPPQLRLPPSEARPQPGSRDHENPPPQ